jgi:2-polyprenyl-6-methoxyphenol hydroxylase-like FAD-dependent oxidoreductase
MLGLLLARSGVPVIVVEKHSDFVRDFRGDTIHPSTLDLIDHLGLRRRFDEVPHSTIRALDVVVNGNRLTPALLTVAAEGRDSTVLTSLKASTTRQDC